MNIIARYTASFNPAPINAEYISCIKEILKSIEDAKTYGIPVAQLLLNMKAFCEETMLSPKACEGRDKQLDEWRKLLGYSDDVDLDVDD